MHEDGFGFGRDVQAFQVEGHLSLSGDVLVLNKVLLSSGENSAQGNIRGFILALHLPDLSGLGDALRKNSRLGQSDLMRSLMDLVWRMERSVDIHTKRRRAAHEKVILTSAVAVHLDFTSGCVDRAQEVVLLGNTTTENTGPENSCFGECFLASCFGELVPKPRIWHFNNVGILVPGNVDVSNFKLASHFGKLRVGCGAESVCKSPRARCVAASVSCS